MPGPSEPRRKAGPILLAVAVIAAVALVGLGWVLWSGPATAPTGPVVATPADPPPAPMPQPVN